MTKREQAIFDRQRRILDLLTKSGFTINEIAPQVGMSRVVIGRDIDELHECREVRIEEWRPVRGVYSAVYRAGCEPDVEMPESVAHRWAAFGETMQKRAEQKRVPAERHWLDVALFGEYRRTA
jgi:predicted ArsR family transcriptional regulator